MTALRKQLGPRLDTYLRLFAAFFTLEVVLRLLFLLIFVQKEENPNWADICKALWIGVRFDLRVALLLAAPWLILSFIPWLNLGRCISNNNDNNNHGSKNKTAALTLWSVIYTFFALVVAVTYAGDFGYYAYLSSRINITIFEFTQAFDISLKMVHETYNLYLWLPLLGLFTAGTYIFFRQFFFTEKLVWSRKWQKKLHPIIVGVLTFLIFAVGVHNSFTQYPLRWSQAFFSQSVFVSALALNPLHYMVDTAENPQRDFDRAKVEKYYDTVANYLGVINKDKKNLNFQRPVEPTNIEKYLSTRAQKPNVVYIVMESMAAYKTGVFNNAAKASPVLDKMAEAGILFKNFYTPTEGTARSMFCLLTGIPDINAKSTSSRNPLIVNQHTLVNAFKKYEKYYFIGGSASWGNIRGVYQNNVENLKMYEEGQYDKPNTDVWGLSDLDLFRETARILNARDTAKPFFAIIQAASFHRPYTIPEDRGEFKIQNLPDADLKRFGFNSNEEYNSFRFSDYSMGEFFNLIQNAPWFENTIFVVHGDHGLPHEGAENIPEGYKTYNLNRFHVPLVIYSPLLRNSLIINDFATEPDVLPTLVGLTGHSATNTTLGRNLLADEKEPRKKRYAFSYVYYSDPLQVMLYDDEHLAFGTEIQIDKLFNYAGPTPKENIASLHSERFQEMQELLMGIFQTSKYMLFHNQRENVK